MITVGVLSFLAGVIVTYAMAKADKRKPPKR